MVEAGLCSVIFRGSTVETVLLLVSLTCEYWRRWLVFIANLESGEVKRVHRAQRLTKDYSLYTFLSIFYTYRYAL